MRFFIHILYIFVDVYWFYCKFLYFIDDNVVSHYFTNRKRTYKIKNLFTYLGDITSKNNHLK